MQPKQYLALLLALLLCLPGMALAAYEDSILLEEEDVDFFYAQMEYLVDTIGHREAYGAGGVENARDYLLETLASFGYTEAAGNLDKTPPQGSSRLGKLLGENLTATLPARTENAPIVVLCAHYDSVINGPGARDNASGAAAVLALLQHFTQQGLFENLELRFIFFTAEETGHQGSLGYVTRLTEAERQRMIAVYNIDILVADTWEDDLALSLDTLGMRVPDGYVDGTPDSPANNQATRAFIQARQEQGGFDPEELGLTYCDPRHLGDSDHESFHNIGVDSVNVCFRGNEESDGHWPSLMHSPDDGIGDFDWDRTYQALDTLMLAVEGLAQDPEYGGGIAAE